MIDRKKLSMLLVETDNGVQIELYKDGGRAENVFDELKGKPGDPMSRVTFLTLDWEKQEAVIFKSKVIPEITPVESPWGYRIGEGPIEEPEE